MKSEFGPIIIGLGILTILVGLIVWSGGLGWIGKLPGDIRIEKGNTRIYFPIASMILLSVIASVVMYLVRRLF